MKVKKSYYVIFVLLISFIFLSFVVVKNNNVFLADKSVFDYIINYKSPYLTSILYPITMLGSTLSVILILIILLFVFYKKDKLFYYKYLLINTVFSTLLMSILKNTIKRPRPEFKWIKQGGYSYPSGHTITALVLYGTLILIVNKTIKGKKKHILNIILSIIIFLISLSRIYFAAHYFTDVLASILLGFIILIVSSNFIKEQPHDKNKDK